MDLLYCVDRSGSYADEGDEDADIYFCITPREYFERRGCLDDCFENWDPEKEDYDVELPPGFHNAAESSFQFSLNTGLSREDAIAYACKQLEAIGIEHSQAMDDYINNYKV